MQEENNELDSAIDEDNNLVPNELKEVLNSIPDESVKEKIKKVSISMMTSSGLMPQKHPFEKILTKDHLSQIISNSEKESDREYNNSKSTRRYVFATLVVVILFILALIYLLGKDNPLIS